MKFILVLYIVVLCVFKPIFLLIIEVDAIFINETHHWSLPTRTLNEVDYNVKEPILCLHNLSSNKLTSSFTVYKLPEVFADAVFNSLIF